MNIKEFCALLDKENPYAESVIISLKSLEKHTDCIRFERKGEGLLCVVQELRDRRLYPVIDKKLELIIGVEDACHQLLTQELFRYYYYEGDPEMKQLWIDPYISSDLYVLQGMGYFISSVRPNIIVLGREYQPDTFDKDLFTKYQLRFVD